MTRKRRGHTALATPPETPPRGFAVDAVVVFAVALAVRLVHVWQMRGTPFFSVLMGDARGYDRWAMEIAGGDWMGREVFYQAPLYPYVLGALYTIAGHDLLIVRVVQALIGAAGCVALAYAAGRWVSRAIGLIAGLMLALYPPAIFFDGLIQKSVLDVFFVCVTLALLARLSEAGGRPSMWAALGATLGALSLTRENALVLVALVIVWAVSRGRREGSQAPAALVVVGLAIVLAPVVVRNYVVAGGVYLTTSQFGSNLFIGNNAQADGSYVALRAGRGSPEFERIDAKALAEESSGRALTAGEVSRYWTRQTLAYITAQPGDWLRLLARKARLLVSRTEIIDTESQASHAAYSWPLRILARVWHFGVALPLAVVGGWALWRDRRRLWIVYAMGLAYAATVVVFFVVARYRHPMMPIVLFFSAAGVSAIVDLASRREPRAMLAPLTAAALAALVANWPVTLQGSAEAITENNLGTALQEDGRIDEAIDRYKQALAIDSRYVPALNNLGTALRAAGRLDEAVATYGQAIEAGSDAASVHYNLGNALMAKGDAAGAAAEFRKALAINPRFVEAMNNLGQALDAAGDQAQAIAILRRAIQVDANSAVAHRNLANALASSGASTEAASQFREAIRLAPGDAAIRYDYGSLLIEGGAFAAAVTELAEAIRLKSDYAEAHNNLGIALASQGRLGDAITHWNEALRLKPDLADARANLERARRR